MHKSKSISTHGKDHCRRFKKYVDFFVEACMSSSEEPLYVVVREGCENEGDKEECHVGKSTKGNKHLSIKIKADKAQQKEFNALYVF